MISKKAAKPTFNVSQKELVKLGTYNGFTVGYFKLTAPTQKDMIKKVYKIRSNYKKWIDEARARIQKIGFRWKRTALVFTDYAPGNLKNKPAGGASSHLIIISPDSDPAFIVDTIVHEWSHQWLFNQSEEIKNKIEEVRKGVKKEKNWYQYFGDYAISNLDEFWVFLIEKYDRLPKKYQNFVKEIVFLGN
jgi:hypothetical protein